MAGQAVFSVEDDPTGVPALDVSDGELGVIYPGRPRTHEYGVEGRSYPVDPPQVCVSADPLTIAGRGRDSTVERLGDLEHYPRTLCFHVVDEGPIKGTGPHRKGSDRHGNPRLLKGFEPTSLNAPIGVLGGGHNPADAGPDDGFGTRGCFAVVTAGLERNVQRGTVAASSVSALHGIC